MFKPYYSSGKRQSKLIESLMSWQGTSFRHHCSVKKEGVDCIRFVAKILEETGVKEGIKVPDYPRDWHMHTSDSQLVIGLVSRIKCVNVWASDSQMNIIPRNGDIILYLSGKAVSHAGVYFDEYVHQSLYPTGVIIKRYFDEKWFPKRRFCFCVLEEY